MSTRRLCRAPDWEAEAGTQAMPLLCWRRKARRGPVGLKASPRRLPPGKEVPARGLLMLTKLFSSKAKKLREPRTFGGGGGGRRRRSSFSMINSILECRRPVKAHTLSCSTPAASWEGRRFKSREERHSFLPGSCFSVTF